MDTANVILGIQRGDFDGDLGIILDNVKQRQERVVRGSVRAGDSVMIQGTGTQYLNGLIGRVERVNQKTISVTFPDPDQRAAARRFGNYGVRLQIANVVKVEA